MQEGLIKILNSKQLPPGWFKRQKADKKAGLDLENDVKSIIERVKNDGDNSLIEFALKFDKSQLRQSTLRVSQEEIKEAYKEVSKQQIAAIEFMKRRVGLFQKQLLNQSEVKTFNEGIVVQTSLSPIESVGCYVPGGQASYPSSVVMTVIPAKIAGVPRIVVCSPSNFEGKINSLILVASDLCGVNEIYKIGGAQAIAALAYGTETIAPVRKIVGPGSKYVTTAKILVSNEVAIDMPAGPSEVLVLADEWANSQLIAYDIISQAEHGTDSIAALITTSQKLAEDVQQYINRLAKTAPRAEKVIESLSKYGFIIVCEGIEEAIKLCNQFAAEHLEVITSNAKEIAKKLVAGLILIGPYSPVALSDYGSGTNHVLPTGGFAHAFSGLSVMDFMRRVSIVECSKAGLDKARINIKALAETENLPNHFRAIEARFQK